MRSRIQICRLTLTIQSKMSMISWSLTASAATAVNSLELSSAEIADRKIKIWKTHTVPFSKDKNPLDE